MSRKLYAIYKKLYRCFGRQHWWPADSPFEVMVGAILTQNTSWGNVERALGALKKEKLLSAGKLYRLAHRKIASLIRPAGYYNIKTKRLKSFLRFFLKNYQGSIKKMSLADIQKLRRQLLSVNGIGPETADSILLYALNKPVFVVDAYTRRVLCRHKLIKENEEYAQVQSLFMKHLKTDTRLFNEYHALLVKLGKDFCHKSKPLCQRCPLN